ncbi:hypothetical protein TVNIR_1470 [Thioalkalivibrio nitratireducens DSM 14787]|uniref:Uncharacterized protein n=1 Tax=Thioalkalivibrio nitratireducens (strain DSM 14787 / UNIQEM 213 / ALEN2) TaxID=1255043 RepID=L0DVY6_THIND|nr:hypothetical protein TVNIR_1470 [Thioalkalivibrio nitratireducens DSM 14787]
MERRVPATPWLPESAASSLHPQPRLPVLYPKGQPRKLTAAVAPPPLLLTCGNPAQLRRPSHGTGSHGSLPANFVLRESAGKLSAGKRHADIEDAPAEHLSPAPARDWVHTHIVLDGMNVAG